jgi:hypothetical protein
MVRGGSSTSNQAKQDPPDVNIYLIGFIIFSDIRVTDEKQI